MKDVFGNKKPVQIEGDEWWFNGRVIQQQQHPKLSKYISFNDLENDYKVECHTTFADAEAYCLLNPCNTPDKFPKDYIGGN